MVYQPKGRQVVLSGGPQSVGFQPVKAYDASSSIQQASNQQLANFERVSNAYVESKYQDAQILSQFSDTLNKFIFEQAKTHNENEYKLGLASVLNGEYEPKPELAQQYHDEAAELKQAVMVDEKLNNEVAKVSPGAALEQRSVSPAQNGWRAYGVAVGKAKMGATAAQAVMGQLMSSDTPSVPIVGPDGQVRMMAPSQARTPAEWQAAWASSLQVYIDQAGLTNINPIILAEELTPTMLSVKSNMFNNHMAQVKKVMQEEAIERGTINIALGIDLLDPMDSVAVSNFWQQASSELQLGTGFSRGEANAKAIELILSRAKVTRNEDLLEALATTPLIADQPNGITLGQMYGEQFEQVAGFIREDRERVRQETERSMDEAADNIMNELYLGTREVQDPTQVAGLKQNAKAALLELAGLGNQKAINFLAELDAQDDNYNQMRAKDIARDLRANPFSHSQAEIREELRKGYINAEEARMLEGLLPGNEALEAAKELYPEIDKLAKGVYNSMLDREGIPPQDGASVAALYEGQYADVLKEQLNELYARNPNTSRSQARDFLAAKVKELSADKRFMPIIKDGRVIQPYQFTKGGFIVPNVGGRTPTVSRDFTALPPAQIRMARPRATTDRMLTPAELNKAQEDLMNGKQPTGRVAQLMGATGLSAEQLIRAQSQAINNPIAPGFDTSPAISASRARSQLAPSAAAILSHPNATRAQRMRAWADIGISKEIAARRQREQEQSSLSGGPDMAPGTQMSMDDFVRLGYANGLRGNQLIQFAAIGMAESGGRSGVINSNRKTGDYSIGAWQINMIDDLGPQRIRQFGLRAMDDLKDPETNARVAAQLLKSSGFSTWGAYNDGRYRQFIPDATRALSRLQQSGFNRAGRGGGRSANMTPQNVQSITFDDGQPGIDLWFADKNFGAVLPGRVKEISSQYGPGNTGYGNFIVVESTDPATGQKVDVLYAHLDKINVREGDTIRPGQVIGKQGGTGRVVSSDGTIASIDFLAPAPRGSKSMTPYRDYDRLRRRIAQQIQSGQFR